MLRCLCFGTLFALVLIAGAALAEEPVDADVLLSGGLLLDGTGQPAVAGDLALRDGRIVAAGKITPGKIERTIDCRGLIVAPGFIDLHNHSDLPILEEKTRAAVNYLTQGCTTLVTGNCGSGHVNVGEFLRKLQDQGVGINIAHLIPQGAVREKVIGKVKRAATEDEVRQMQALIDQGMRDGAYGMTTGLIYVPSAFADTKEITALAGVVAQHGGIYASHIRNEGETLLEAIEEALTIGKQAGLPVHISHFKSTGKDNWGKIRAAAARIEEARKEGQVVTADQYPYPASSTSLAATVLESGSREGDNEALIARLKDPQIGAALREEIARSLARKGRLQIATYKPKPDWVGKMLDEIATLENREQADVAVEMLTQGGAAVVNFGMSEEDVRYAMTLPWVATASDGSVKVDDGTRPHPRSFGTFTRKIGCYAVREKILSLEQAVRSCSGLPADILGLKDRGYLRVGLAADVVVFDPKTIIDHATYTEPFRHSEGIKWLFVNGNAAIEDGQPNGKLHGKPLRKGETRK